MVRSSREPVALVIHESLSDKPIHTPSECWVAKIHSLDYTGPNPQAALEVEWKLAPKAIF